MQSREKRGKIVEQHLFFLDQGNIFGIIQGGRTSLKLIIKETNNSK